ncbi:MAG: type II secretion system protein [Oscillospiraceae bacterium]
MKKFIRGFTLIELIIVMAIMTILMAALMQLMKPIRSTYVDATYYEAQRTTQNGIVQYLTESLRYATALGVYNEQESGISNVNDAISKFKASTGLTDESKLNIITIDNKTGYTYNNATLYGRIVRSKKPPASGNYTSDVAVAGTSEARLALGDAYYGKYTYSINVEKQGTGTTINGLKITVSSLVPSSLNNAKKSGTTVKTGDVSGYKCVSTEGEVVCLNLMAPVSGFSDSTYAGTSTTTNGLNTYIIFTLPE